MLKIIPFKKEHLECMNMREHEKNLFDDVDSLVGLESGIAITGIVDGVVMCCGGVIIQYGGNATVWLIPSKYIETVSSAFAKYVKKWLEEKQKIFCLNRMESLCLSDDLHTRWMTFLGFEKEGVKRKWMNDVDYVMWGRLWE